MRKATSPFGRRLNARTCALSALLTVLTCAALAADGPRVPVVVATASSHDGNVPANAVDGSLATRWSANGEGQWLQLDLGLPATVGSVRIAWHKGDLRQSLFEVQTSNDAASWTTVLTDVSSGETTEPESCDVADTTARYVRLVCHGTSLDVWNSIAEVEIYAPATVPVPAPTINSTPLVVQSVSASSHDGNVPANTLDGSLATRWSAQGDGQWISYKLGTSSLIGSVRIAWHSGNSRIALFDIQTSTTGTAWKPVYTGASSGTSAGLETYNVTDSTGQYVRIVGHGNSQNLWNSITEVQILGTNSGGVITNPPTTPPPPTGSSLPSSRLNLTNWKLTLPIETSHAGNPDEYLQPELNGYQHPEYFHLNGTRDGVVFKAHCGGATTSGSGYPRSELREMANNGSTRASWSTTSGTHTMEITQAITHRPVAKPHVVVGQIHDASDDVIVFRLEGSTLFIDENGNRGPVLTTNYRLGDVFTTKFVARNGGVECYYNGRYIYTYRVSTSGCYFKAGCYTQSNTSKGDSASAYGEVVIYALKVTHQ